MERLLAAYNRAAIVAGLQLHDALSATGKNWDDVRGWLAENPVRTLADIAKEKLINRSAAERHITKICPLCQKTMKLIPVTSNDKYKSKWLCGSGCGSCNAGGGCGYVEYNEQSIEEIIKQGGAQ